MWSTLSTLVQRHVSSLQMHLPCQCQWELNITMPPPSLEAEGQTVWQEGVARQLTILWPDWRSGDLERLPNSLSRASSSFQVFLRASWKWVPIESPFHDNSFIRGQDWITYQLTPHPPFLFVRGSRGQHPSFHQSCQSLIGTCLSNRSHTVVKKPCRAARLRELNSPSGKISNHPFFFSWEPWIIVRNFNSWITNLSSSSRFYQGF